LVTSLEPWEGDNLGRAVMLERQDRSRNVHLHRIIAIRTNYSTTQSTQWSTGLGLGVDPALFPPGGLREGGRVAPVVRLPLLGNLGYRDSSEPNSGATRAAVLGALVAAGILMRPPSRRMIYSPCSKQLGGHHRPSMHSRGAFSTPCETIPIGRIS